jgi:hypothetical protein
MHAVAEDLRINSCLTQPEFEVLLRLSFAPIDASASASASRIWPPTAS